MEWFDIKVLLNQANLGSVLDPSVIESLIPK
jgi:hypothetical protein